MVRYCRTCHQPKDLSAFWLAPASGRANVSAPSLHCIQCHEEGHSRAAMALTANGTRQCN